MTEPHDDFLHHALAYIIGFASIIFSNLPSVDTFFHYAGETIGFGILVLQILISWRQWKHGKPKPE